MSQTKVKSGLLNFPDQTDFVKLPSGTTAQRPSSPEKGYSRYNTTDNKLEYWNGTEWQQLPGITPPIITSISYPGDDLAADPDGGQTITINGSDFITGATVTVDGTTPSVITFVSATEITFTAPAKTAGDYDIVVTNTDGGNATAVDGMTYNGLPSWTTPAGNLGTFEENTTIPTITLVAAEPDSGLISYSITTGGLPTGLSLTGADIDGTTPAVAGETTYNFTVTATDNENQSTERAFNIVVYKFVPSFNTVLYSGTSATMDINNVGFQPDLIWTKCRTNTYSNMIVDSVRGGEVNLRANTTSAEEGLAKTTFDAEGYNLIWDGSANSASFQVSGETYVAWCWRAGGTAVTNTDGTISAQVSANVDAGFSIVKWTGGSGTGLNVGHGLGVAPSFIILRPRDRTSDWYIYHKDLASNQSLRFDASPANTVLSFPNVNNLNFNSDWTTSTWDFIAYCFAEVAGFSKFGSYTGGSTGSGNVIDVGFKPMFVMVKRYNDGLEDWLMFDSVRGGGDTFVNALRANTNEAESLFSLRQINFVDNGFYWTQAESAVNGAGGEYIYMAFANQF